MRSRFEELRKLAQTIGPNTARLFERIMNDKPHPEMGYRGCLGNQMHPDTRILGKLFLGERGPISAEDALWRRLHAFWEVWRDHKAELRSRLPEDNGIGAHRNGCSCPCRPAADSEKTEVHAARSRFEELRKFVDWLNGKAAVDRKSLPIGNLYPSHRG